MGLGDYLIAQQRFILTLTAVVPPFMACLLFSPNPKSVFLQGSSVSVTTSPSIKGIRHKTTHSIQRDLVLEYEII